MSTYLTIPRVQAKEHSIHHRVSFIPAVSDDIAMYGAHCKRRLASGSAGAPLVTPPGALSCASHHRSLTGALPAASTAAATNATAAAK